jgi:hypothetical protein
MGIEADLSADERSFRQSERTAAERVARLVSKERLSGSDELNVAIAFYEAAVVARQNAVRALSEARGQRVRDAFARKRSMAVNGDAANPSQQ